jgi:hypothetical protein
VTAHSVVGVPQTASHTIYIFLIYAADVDLCVFCRELSLRKQSLNLFPLFWSQFKRRSRFPLFLSLSLSLFLSLSLSFSFVLLRPSKREGKKIVFIGRRHLQITQLARRRTRSALPKTVSDFANLYTFFVLKNIDWFLLCCLQLNLKHLCRHKLA